MRKLIRQLLNHYHFIKKTYRSARHKVDMIYKMQDLNDNYYDKIKNLGDKEIEHQIGRLKNFKKIVSEIEEKKLTGDVLEFGTWRGFSFLWIAYLFERCGILNKKFVGIDGFVGLPNAEGFFQKGAFSNTSKKICENNIILSKHLYSITKNNIYVEKFMYSQQGAILRRLNDINANKFCFIHIDCDISSSAIEIFALLKSGDLLSDSCYILFDDYELTDSYKNTVNDSMKNLESEWIIQEHSKTNLTKNYYLQKKHKGLYEKSSKNDYQR